MISTRTGLQRIAAARHVRSLAAVHVPSSPLASSRCDKSSLTWRVAPSSATPWPTTSSNLRLFSSSADEANDETKDASKEGSESKVHITPESLKKKETIEFKAETKQILKIMTHSLYTDKEVFIRELVSNASDALEKLRHAQAANTSAVIDSDLPMEIRIELDEVSSSITITDTGIGMTREDMVDNLGTIARSGSRQFMEDLEKIQEGEDTVDAARGIIGKFGVGFYSVFMVAEKVEVISRSALKSNKGKLAQVWTSDGSAFELADMDEGIRQFRGTSIKIYLDEKYWKFVDEKKIEGILNKYSNFVGFPIYLEGKKLNAVEAIWTKDPKEVEEEKYVEFYKYIANAFDDPFDIYHFRADAPLDIKALFFIPSFHTEKFGQERMQPSVSLYCRKVLIEAKSPDIVPDWMRFVKGVVDSEDLPLAISREKVQDSALIGKLRTALTRKFISHLSQLARKDKDSYINEFYKEYAFFLKEGACQDFEFQPQLSKLLYYETNKNEQQKMISLDEYIANMKPEQKEIYYLVAPDRDSAMNSPYLEAFNRAGVEVILLFTAVDDFVMGNLKEYEGRPLVSIEKSDIDLKDIATDDDGKDDDIYKADNELTTEEKVNLCTWFRKTFDSKLASCIVTDRLSNSPAIITDHESGSLRRMMRMLETTEASKEEVALPKQHMEINPGHKIIVGINSLKETNPILAKVLAEQIIDNCLVAAGLMDDSRTMLPRLNDIMLCVVNGASADGSQAYEEALIQKNKAKTDDTSSASPPKEEKEADSESKQ